MQTVTTPDRPAPPEAPAQEADVPTSARGRRFTWAVVLAWPLGVAIGLVAMLFGAGAPIAIAGGLSVALGINFVWIVSVFAVDDGRIDERVREQVRETTRR